MTRKLKMLGMALVAVLALTAVVASAASAASYTASSYPTTGTAESALGNDTFITEAGKVECKSHFEGTLSAASSSLAVKAKYTSCKAFGFLEGTLNTGTCHKLYTEPTGSGDSWHASAIHETCTGPTIIIFIFGTCEMTIGSQTYGGTVSITKNTAAGDLSTKASLTGIKYTVTKDGIGCPFNGTGAKTGGEYKQDTAVTFDSTNGATIDVG